MRKSKSGYQQEFEEAINELCVAEGKKIAATESEEVIKKKSTTDSESGLFVKEELLTIRIFLTYRRRQS